MLRITSSTQDGTTRIKLEGRLVGRWVDECRAACAPVGGRNLVLDVSEVRYADPRGAELLRELGGAGLVAKGSGYTAEVMRRRDSTEIDRDERRRGEASTGECTDGLVARLRAGHETACEELVRRHGGAMLATARRFLGRESEAVEALKAAFQTAFRRAGECARDAELEAWLQRLVVDACVARLRQEASPAAALDGLPGFDARGSHARPIAPWPTPEHDVSSAWLAEVRRCIDELPSPYRVVVLLASGEGLGTPEIAARLGLPHAEVTERLHRARQALIGLLGPTLARRAAV